LHWAIIKNRVDCARYLLSMKADYTSINLKN